jgi:KTSC domain
MKSVDSSMISKVGYDANLQTLRIVFLSTGQLVDYFNVPEYIYHDLLKSKSAGTYMNNFVINNYEYKNVEAEKR